MFVPLVTANIVSLCIESMLCGVFCTLFVISLYPAARKPSTDTNMKYPRPMLVFSIVIFLVITTHCSLSAARTVQAFFLYLDGQNPAAFFGDVYQFTAVFREGMLLGLLVIGDLTIVYRLWAIWSHHKGVIIVPMVLLVGLSALAVMNLYVFFVPGTNLLQNPGKFEANISIWTGALCTTTFCMNLYCTGMIGYKLWKVGRVTRDRESISRFTFVVAILVESLSLYTVWGIFFLVFYELGSFLYILISDTQSPVTGIAFVILNVRVGMRRSDPASVVTLDVSGRASGAIKDRSLA
ncbi:hypothetical protein BD779DRAFT_1536911 [Infundibulicybe gibba]|nr:hypothetical protein BD779DRAFT_1536911 [Infundibulicybe gibba]